MDSHDNDGCNAATILPGEVGVRRLLAPLPRRGFSSGQLGRIKETVSVVKHRSVGRFPLRFLLALPMLAYLVLHFVYTDFVASIVPPWIPCHMFWTYFTAYAIFAERRFWPWRLEFGSADCWTPTPGRQSVGSLAAAVR